MLSTARRIANTDRRTHVRTHARTHARMHRSNVYGVVMMMRPTVAVLRALLGDGGIVDLPHLHVQCVVSKSCGSAVGADATYKKVGDHPVFIVTCSLPNHKHATLGMAWLTSAAAAAQVLMLSRMIEEISDVENGNRARLLHGKSDDDAATRRALFIVLNNRQQVAPLALQQQHHDGNDDSDGVGDRDGDRDGDGDGDGDEQEQQQQQQQQQQQRQRQRDRRRGAGGAVHAKVDKPHQTRTVVKNLAMTLADGTRLSLQQRSAISFELNYQLSLQIHCAADVNNIVHQLRLHLRGLNLSAEAEDDIVNYARGKFWSTDDLNNLAANTFVAQYLAPTDASNNVCDGQTQDGWQD